jgi:hypothetical protein
MVLVAILFRNVHHAFLALVIYPGIGIIGSTKQGDAAMTYQIYELGEWERIGGADGYSTMSAYAMPNTYETEACAHAIAARLADWSYNHGGDGGFVVVEYGKSPHRDALHNPKWAYSAGTGADNCDDMPW